MLFLLGASAQPAVLAMLGSMTLYIADSGGTVGVVRHHDIIEDDHVLCDESNNWDEWAEEHE